MKDSSSYERVVSFKEEYEKTVELAQEVNWIKQQMEESQRENNERYESLKIDHESLKSRVECLEETLGVVKEGSLYKLKNIDLLTR